MSRKKVAPVRKALELIGLEMEASHALKELKQHAPHHVAAILKYINELKKRARHVFP